MEINNNNLNPSSGKLPARDKPHKSRLSQKIKRALFRAAIIGKGLEQMSKSGYKGKMLSDEYFIETFGGHKTSEIKVLFKEWKEDSSTHLNFHNWVKDVKKITLDSSSQVQYLNEKQRDEYKVCLSEQDGKVILTRNGQPYDTEKEKTEFSGDGVAIFVVGPDETLYCGTHTYNKFHHSSFLAGGAVIAAGEIIIKNGVIEAFTNKTGHYQSGKKEVCNFLRFLKKNNINIEEVQYVEMVFSKGSSISDPIVHQGSEFYEQNKESDSA